jgi:putative endopeptidase
MVTSHRVFTVFGALALGTGFWLLASTAPHLEAQAGGFGLDLAAMDRSVAPGDDFYRYVNGTWLKTTQIPSDMARFAEFGRLAELNANRNKSILEKAAAAPTTAEEKKVGDFYASLMDDAAREAAGMAPLKPELDRIAGIATPADLARAIALVSRDWLRPLPGGAAPLPPSPINIGVSVDIKSPTRYLPSIGQGGLGLPDRDYFLASTTRRSQRDAYKASRPLFGPAEPVPGGARGSMRSRSGSRRHWTRASSAILTKPTTLHRAELPPRRPASTGRRSSGRRLRQCAGVLVSQPSAITTASLATREAPLQDWKDYLVFRSIRAFAPFGPKALVAENFDFQSRTLAGTPEMPAPWKTASALTDQAIGHAVGALSQGIFPRRGPRQGRADDRRDQGGHGPTHQRADVDGA